MFHLVLFTDKIWTNLHEASHALGPWGLGAQSFQSSSNQGLHHQRWKEEWAFKSTFKISIAFWAESAFRGWPFCFCVFICQHRHIIKKSRKKKNLYAVVKNKKAETVYGITCNSRILNVFIQFWESRVLESSSPSCFTSISYVFFSCCHNEAYFVIIKAQVSVPVHESHKL